MTCVCVCVWSFVCLFGVDFWRRKASDGEIEEIKFDILG